MKIIQALKCIVSIPKSLFFCIKYLPLKQALHIPILLSYKVKLKEIHGGGYQLYLTQYI